MMCLICGKNNEKSVAPIVRIKKDVKSVMY